MPSSKRPPAKKPSSESSSQTGRSATLEYMKASGIPLTRERYLNLAYMGKPPEELGAEEEAMLPEMFRRKD